MVFKIIRQEAEPLQGGAEKQLKGVHQAQVHLDQMVLVMARQVGWTAGRRWPKELRTKLSSKGTTRLEFTQIRWFLW
jgi:hypothetical protein